ncbi:uncharacterized protein K02A2.6-like [Teleopsis dalmanni]|uniref:uncharacterized protein K02A2.6-like n=1 Tax=Teleopsis dalmanni TaxID=139649 RepID=UPI0018CD59E0|nr:uncharacterized protein K02A2.6-like [Teleopsis dalmanni]
MPTKTLLHSWPTPSEQWERVHIDYAGPIEGWYFLVIVQTKAMSSQATVNILNDIFARFGLPKTIASDNGTQFRSEHFEQFLKHNGVEHLYSSPYYPMSNGQAERFVDTFKRSLKKLEGEGTITQNLCTFLQTYRSTPNVNSPEKRSPAEVMFGRKMRINLDLLQPKKLHNAKLSPNKFKMEKQFNKRYGAKEIKYFPSDKIYANIPNGVNRFKWMPGEVIEKKGKVMYNVILNNGKLIRIHCNQLRKRYHDQNNNHRFWEAALDVYDLPQQSNQFIKALNNQTLPNILPLSTSPTELPIMPTTISTPTSPVLRRTTRNRKAVTRFQPQ